MQYFRRRPAPPPDDYEDGVDLSDAGPRPADLVVDQPMADGPQLPPSRLQGTEPLYGYVLGAELLVVSILTILIRHGSGAPAHLSSTDKILILVGPVVVAAYLGVLQLRNRTVTAFGAVFAGYVISVPAGPTWLKEAHLFSLVVTVVYALLVSQRVRKDTKRALATGRAAPRRPEGRPERARSARSASGERRKRGGQPAPTGPTPNGRYTPPKAKKAPAKRSR